MYYRFFLNNQYSTSVCEVKWISEFDCTSVVTIILQKTGGVLSNVYIHAVIVSTKKRDDSIEISVEDNGPGIPQNIINKIFQPFFITKPAGQGIGVGLSLAYDIVKAHGGDLKIETLSAEAAAQAGKEALPSRQISGDPVGRGEGSVFTIQLSI